MTFNAAQQLQKQGDLADAAQLFQQVLTAQPNNYAALYNLGVIAQQQHNFAAALYQYGRALKVNPRFVPALYNSATIYGTTRPRMAITIYRQVVTLQPVAPTAYLNLGLLEIKHGQPRLGIKDLATAVSQDSSLLPQVPAHLRRLVESQVPSRRHATASPSSAATAST